MYFCYFAKEKLSPCLVVTAKKNRNDVDLLIINLIIAVPVKPSKTNDLKQRRKKNKISADTQTNRSW